jgi:hypothetical protein
VALAAARLAGLVVEAAAELDPATGAQDQDRAA